MLSIVFSCSSPASDKLPPAPAHVKAVHAFLQGKNLSTKKVGFFDNLTVNTVTEIKWIDISNEKDPMNKEVAEEELAFSLQFLNDTAVSISKKEKKFEGKYVVNDILDEYADEKPGIRLRITYADPESGFADMFMSDVIYSFLVIGLDDKKIILQTPRSINRQKLISLMSE